MPSENNTPWAAIVCRSPANQTEAVTGKPGFFFQLPRHYEHDEQEKEGVH